MPTGLEPVARWFDSHCHLQERYLTGDPSDDDSPGEARDAAVDPLVEALGRAAGAGVERMVCVGTDRTTSEQALGLARAVRSGELGRGLPEVWATLGLHPHDASLGVGTVASLLEEASRSDEGLVVGVGECGLDYHYEHSPRSEQRQVFASQIGLAQQLGLTLVIHARDAWDDLFDVLGTEGVPERTILHCFTGGEPEVERCLEAGMFVSFSGIATFKNAPEVRAAAARCPLDRLLVETDSPFLAPVPHRGRPNEPSFVPIVGVALAATRQMDPDELAATSWDAASRAFGLKQ